MPLPRPEELLQAVIDACRLRTDAVFFEAGTNPFSLSLGERNITLFIANVTQSSGRAATEFRIQCPGSLPGELLGHKANGREVFVLGYSWELDIFTAWEPDRLLERSQQTQRFSLYTRRSSLTEASQKGFGIYRDTAEQHVLSFRPEFLATYLDNSSVLHLARDTSLVNLADAIRDHDAGQSTKKFVTVAKRKIVVSHRQFVRNRRFRQAVLDAYSNRCAMCGLQLELIEAAHLVPHAHPKGVDTVVNGLALCTLHHEALDSGLIYVDTSYNVHLNRTRVSYLRRVGKVDGLGRFRRHLQKSISLPKDASEVPDHQYIALGNRVRGIELG